MAVQIGKVKLIGVQDLHTEETRNLVEQRVPDQQGSLFQDLGRDPVNIVIEGVMFGAAVLEDLERLRVAQAKAEPQSFAADVAVGTDLTEVVIEDVKVRQVAGYPNRFRFTLRLREHTEPPESPAQAVAPVDDAVAADADAWAGDAVAASAAVQDPGAIPEILAENPGALNQLSSGELADAVSGKVDAISGEQFAGIMESVGKLDPDKAGALFESLNNKGVLGQLVAKVAQAGMNLKQLLKGIPLKDVVKNLVNLFTGGTEWIQQAQKVGEAAKKLAEDLKGFNPVAGLEQLKELK